MRTRIFVCAGAAALAAIVIACGSESSPSDPVLDAGTNADAGSSPTEDASNGLGANDAGTLDAQADSGCEIGSVASSATPGNLDLFGTPTYFNDGEPLPAGRYRFTYMEGCQKFGSGQGWTVNAYETGNACWYAIGETTNDRFTVLPGTIGYTVGSGAFDSFEECEAASLQAAPVEIELPAPSKLGIWLLDSPYNDNVAGPRNPRWRLEKITTECGN